MTPTSKKVVAPYPLLSTQALILVTIAHHPAITLRDIGHRVDLTERQVWNNIEMLVEEGYVTRSKQGRVNVYMVDRKRRDPMTGITIGKLIDAAQAD